MRLKHRIVALFGGRRVPAGPPTGQQHSSPPVSPVPPAGAAPAPGIPALGTLAPSGPGAATGDLADPCGPSRVAVDDACSLADRMHALALASAERLRDARRAYDEHAGRRERAAAAADPRAIRAAKDEAQHAFRTARVGARERGALETAAREWLREIDRINARTREAVRLLVREDTAEAALLHAVERLGLEADGARIAAESAGEACRNARIALAACEESERLGRGRPAAPELLAPASVVARATTAPTSDPAPRGATPEPGPATSHPADATAAGEPAAGAAGEPANAEPAVLPLLAGDRDVLRRIAATLAEGDAEADGRWQARLSTLVDAVRARAIDGAALTFPDDGFWAPYTQVQGREIAAALAALGYRYDGHEGFADGRIPGQRELSLAIGYAGLDPMRIRIWPSEVELPHLFAGVEVDTGRFVSEAASELTLGDMIDLL
ncbi:MAG TPA: hypothetical protein VE359_21290, partial [Vicinamibacteria bacterium]|nr:hypothetical protein [Vicinamibacteria bacterium]